MKTITGGKEGLGPAAYLPSRYTNQSGKEVQRSDIDSNLKYTSVILGICRLLVSPSGNSREKEKSFRFITTCTLKMTTSKST